ncbi:hypothetical protein ABEG18_13025 [Alsobacter sp. KACC 23698]|uniref:DUF2628 domain-containing protein n=1 Tax=Alsobacter sp. KACC 23698 TaxID=3149229 RepID=A0AAU7JMZ9_9HYPH
MATAIPMQNDSTGLRETGFYGFSWTVLFWGPLPAAFRGDWKTFVVALIVLMLVAAATVGAGNFIANLIWAFFYNRQYTRGLVERGYRFMGSDTENRLAAAATRVVYPHPSRELPRAA